MSERYPLVCMRLKPGKSEIYRANQQFYTEYKKLYSDIDLILFYTAAIKNSSNINYVS